VGKIDVSKLKKRTGSGYPSPFDEPMRGRSRQRLGDAAGLTQFGVNLLVLEPGAWSSQRHWHENEDEFVFVLSGDIALVTDAGEEVMRPGDCAGFAKGSRDGHHLINRSKSKAAVCLEVGTRCDVDYVDYPDIDMIFDSKVDAYAHRDGTLYPPKATAPAPKSRTATAGARSNVAASAASAAKRPAKKATSGKAPRRSGR